MARHSDTRQRLLDSAARLFRRQGYWGTGLQQITSEGGAPWGSLYHFFPGGKEQLGAEAVRASGEGYRHLIGATTARHSDPLDALEAFFALMVDSLERSGFDDGCPIATVAVDVASRSEPVRQACADVFAAWTAEIADGFAAGFGDEAGDVALLALSAFEGAMVLSRARHDTTPLRRVGALLRALLAARIPDAAGAG